MRDAISDCKSRDDFMSWLGRRLADQPSEGLKTIRKQIWYAKWKRLLKGKSEEEAIRWMPTIYSHLDNGAFRTRTIAFAAERSLAVAWVDTFADTTWTSDDLIGILHGSNWSYQFRWKSRN